MSGNKEQVLAAIKDRIEGSTILKIEEVGDGWELQLPQGTLTFAATLNMSMGPHQGFSGQVQSRMYWVQKKEDGDGAKQP